MKKLFGLLATLVVSSVVFAGYASAREGSLSLSNSKIACEGISIWRDSSYRINGRCDGLVYPYATQYDHYVLWAKLGNGNVVRVDDIERGYFDGNIFDDFGSLFITAEASSSPRRPSTKEIVTGKVTAFDFDKSETTVAQPTPIPTTAPTGGMTVQNTTGTTATTSSVGSVVGTILKSLLIIVAVIVVITIGASLLFRRRGSVSG